MRGSVLPASHPRLADLTLTSEQMDMLEVRPSKLLCAQQIVESQWPRVECLEVRYDRMDGALVSLH